MKYFLFSATLLFTFIAPSSFGQSKNVKTDSLRKIQQFKRDSTNAANQLLLEKRREDARIRKQIALAKKKKIVIPITEEFSLGYRLHSDGWTFFIQRGFISTDKDNPHTRQLMFEFGEKRNAKEFKSTNENFTTIYPNEPKPISYKYGKINNFYPLRLGMGNTKRLTGKLDDKTVVINWVYGASLNIGFLKPYYLDILVPEGNVYVRKIDKYSEANKTYFLDLENRGTIVGGADFTNGISEVKIIPGITLRSGFFFDYSATKKSFLGVELGASLELYTKAVPIMALISNKPYFFNVYADFRFGKRWAKKPMNDEVEEF